MKASCKICKEETHLLLSRKVLNKYSGEYYKCSRCGFLQIFEHPWLDEAYSSAITSLDIGLLNRNLEYGPRVRALIKYLIKSKENRYLDYGGGYGLFVRLMRDKGFDYYRYDKYCENIFANSFDHVIEEDVNGSFDLLTAFEVFEHISDPLQELESMLQLSNNIFFSTELLPDKEEEISDWWYLLPEIGQHISFYSRQSLQVIAKKYGLNLYTDGKYFHLLTKEEYSPFLFRLLTRKKVSSALWYLDSGKDSLLNVDYKKLLNSKTTIQ